MNKRNLIRLSAVLLLIFVLNISDLVELKKNTVDFEMSLENDFNRIFSELLYGFHKADTEFKAIKISQLAFLAVPPIFFGQNISADLSISGTYYFTRQDNRTIWYTKRVFLLLIYSFIIAVFTCLLNTLLTLYFDVACIQVMKIILVICSLSFCFFIIIMLSNIIGVFCGSIIALTVSEIFAALNIFLIGTDIKRLSIVFNSAFLHGESYFDMAIKAGINVFISIVLFVIGLIVIKKKELGLVNAEHLL